MTTPSAITALSAAVKGVLYQSESDEPFVAFAWQVGDGGHELSHPRVRSLSGHGAEEHVEEETIDEFFAPLVRHEGWHGDEERSVVDQYQKMAEAVRSVLDVPRVYKIGDGPEKSVYIVGRASTGDWVGVKTTAIET